MAQRSDLKHSTQLNLMPSQVRRLLTPLASIWKSPWFWRLMTWVQIPTLPLPELCNFGKVSSTFWASVSWFLNRVLKSYLSHWVVMRVKSLWKALILSWNIQGPNTRYYHYVSTFPYILTKLTYLVSLITVRYCLALGSSAYIFPSTKDTLLWSDNFCSLLNPQLWLHLISEILSDLLGWITNPLWAPRSYTQIYNNDDPSLPNPS